MEVGIRYSLNDRGDEPPLLVEHLLAERIPLSILGAALDLALHRCRVDALPDVVGGHALQHLDFAGIHIHRNLDRVGAVGVVGMGLSLAGLRIEEIGERRAEHRELGPVDPLRAAEPYQVDHGHRLRRVVHHEDLVVAHVDLARLDAERLSRAFDQPCTNALRRLLHALPVM